jgi:hypothetical protein
MIPQIRQGNSKLLTIMRQNSLICEMISKLLFEHHDVASKFVATCQEASHLLMKNAVSNSFNDLEQLSPLTVFATLKCLEQLLIRLFQIFWQINEGEFNNCENPRFGADADPEHQGEVAPVIIITPIRISKKDEQTDEQKKDEQQTDEKLEHEQRGNYVSQVANLHKMCKFSNLGLSNSIYTNPIMQASAFTILQISLPTYNCTACHFWIPIFSPY